MRPIHKFNNGNGATLCNECRTIISTGISCNKVLCEKCLEQLVYTYKTFAKTGFIQEEIDMLIGMFPNFSIKAFDEAMRGNTCHMTVYKGKDELVNYHCDVLTGLKCGIEDREIDIMEFD